MARLNGDAAMTLDKAQKGQAIKIISFPNDLIRAQAIRFDLSEGTVVTCMEVLLAGPVVICRNRQEIAVGRDLARMIHIEPV